MFGSAILDSAIGVTFGFLAVSLFTSAIVEAIQSSLKTPFWFDALQSLVRLKVAGPSPEEKAKGAAASA